LKSLAKEDIKIVNPTKGFNVKIVTIENISFSVWDLGGQIAIRNVWENYYKDNEALVSNNLKKLKDKQKINLNNKIRYL
jgi:GTPase SAR1 family protein